VFAVSNTVVHQIFPDHHLRRLFRAERAHPFAQGNLAYGHQLRQINFDRSIEFLKIKQSLGRVANGVAILKFKIA
jgi:hypothetical protein